MPWWNNWRDRHVQKVMKIQKIRQGESSANDCTLKWEHYRGNKETGAWLGSTTKSKISTCFLPWYSHFQKPRRAAWVRRLEPKPNDMLTLITVNRTQAHDCVNALRPNCITGTIGEYHHRRELEHTFFWRENFIKFHEILWNFMKFHKICNSDFRPILSVISEFLNSFFTVS